MNIYQEYALNKAKIKDLQDKCKAMEDTITLEVKKNGEPIEKDYGTFSLVPRDKFVFSPKVQEMEKKLEVAKEIEKLKGKAKKTTTESLRFMPSKLALPVGAYDWSAYPQKEVAS